MRRPTASETSPLAFGDRADAAAPARSPVARAGRRERHDPARRLLAGRDRAQVGTADNVAVRPPTMRFDDPILRLDAPPPVAEIRALLRDLHRWLGPRGFHWLAACAV